MIPFARAVAGLEGCILCGRNPIRLVLMVVAVDNASYVAFARLRTAPLMDDELPAFNYGLCGYHASNLKRSRRLVDAKLTAAAAEVSVQ